MPFGMDAIPDKVLLKNVLQRLTRKGTACKNVETMVIRGELTLRGTIPQEADRRAILKACQAIQGLARVVDYLTVEKRKDPKRQS